LVGAGGSGPHNGIKIVIHGPKGSDANFLEPLKQKIGQTLPPGYGKVETVGDAEPFPPKTQSMAGAVKRIEDNRVKLSAPCTGDCLGEIQSAYTKLNAGAPSGPEFEAFSKAVRILHVKKGEILIHAGAPPGLVYLTSKAGGDLSIAPEGHESFASAPSVFLGGTALVANQPRNAQVQATRDTYVFIVPSDLYRTYFSKNIIGPENIPERFGRSPTP
jgi:hypothetical protein